MKIKGGLPEALACDVLRGAVVEIGGHIYMVMSRTHDGKESDSAVALCSLEDGEPKLVNGITKVNVYENAVLNLGDGHAE
jgi:hypothetical protein